MFDSFFPTLWVRVQRFLKVATTGLSLCSQSLLEYRLQVFIKIWDVPQFDELCTLT